jgi:arylsulfatase
VTTKLGLVGLLAAALAALAWPRISPPPEVSADYDLWLHPPAADGGGQPLGFAETIHRRGLRALELLPGKTLRWRLALGGQPTLRARPIAAGDCGLRIAVAAGGENSLVHQSWLTAPEPSFIPPDFLTVDLGRWAGREVELTAGAEERSPGSCAGVRLATASVIEQLPRRRRPRSLRSQAAVAVGRHPPRYNVLLLSVDTLRADALGFWGRSPSLSPAIDRLAARGDTFLRAHSTINNTNPSFISMMTGLYPKDHRIYDLVTPLPDSHETLIEYFDRAGYVTRAVVAATHLGSNAGLGQGVHGLIQPVGQFYGETITSQAMHYLQEPAAMPEPFFLWLHYFDPHVPHNPPSPWARGLVPDRRGGLRPVADWKPSRPLGFLPFEHQPPRFLDGNRQLYEAEVAYLDRQVEKVMLALEEQDLLGRTLVVLVADHGETLGERGNFFDHVGLHANTTHVPMVLLRPGQERGRVFPGLVQSFDLFPTVLELAGLEPPSAIDARDLYSLGETGRPAVFAEHANNSGAMVRTSRHLFYRNAADPLFPRGDFFYDLEKDPAEENNLAGKGDPEETRLAAALENFLAERRDFAAVAPLEIAPEERERLRALGYVN